MNEVALYGELSVIGMSGCEEFTSRVNDYLRQWRPDAEEDYITKPDSIRFETGEAKCVLHNSLRGHDVYIICDMYNYSVKYKMYGKPYPMSPDDHFQDLKRIINAIGGKARRISVIMPLLYESRQDKRTQRESLDCAVALQELTNMGVANIITFDVHNSGIQNAIPLNGFENIHPTYQMIKALLNKVNDISINKDDLIIISPDAGGMSRSIYYSSVLQVDMGMFYKRRDYSTVVNGKNPIIAHEYLGKRIEGKDAIIIDDMISSGESMLDVARQLKSRGARRIFIFATFGLFTSGLDEFDQAYADGMFNQVFTTNLIYRTPELKGREWFTEVNLCKYVALLIDTLNHDQTISGLLKPEEKIHKFVKEYVNKQESR